MDDQAGDAAVGVVGDDGTVTAALEEAGFRPVDGEPAAVLAADPAWVVALGEQALLTLARAEPAVPILPVAAGRGVRSVPRAAVESALDRLAAGDWMTDAHPLLAVEPQDGPRELALQDAMLVTSDPADISEFTVASGGERIARFRADGVVAATPAGSPGYARSAGGPVIQPGADVVAIVPVSPFATTIDHWVVPLGEVTLTVERDEAPVDVLADDRTAGSATVDAPVSLRSGGHVETIQVAEGRSPFARDGRELEKL